MKQIVITGISGFIGQSLSAAFYGKYILVGIGRSKKGEEQYDSFCTWGELSTFTFDNIYAVIHLAGKAHDTKNAIEGQSYYEINTGLTLKIFDKFLESKAEMFIYFSSVKAVTDSVVDDVLTEKITPRPDSIYGKSKLEAENYILSKKWKDKKVYIFRPCMIHGPGNKGNLNLLYSLITKGIPYPLGKFTNKRSFSSIDNLIFIINQVLLTEIPSGVYNIADDEAISTNELVSTIYDVLGKKECIYNIPKNYIQFAAKCGDLFHLPFNTFRLNKLTENYVVSNEKIKKAIGVQYLPVTTKEGLRKTISSFKKNKK